MQTIKAKFQFLEQLKNVFIINQKVLKL